MQHDVEETIRKTREWVRRFQMIDLELSPEKQKEFLAWLDEKFSQEDGPPLSRYRDEPYKTVVAVGWEGTGSAELVEFVKSELETLYQAGARHVVWRIRPYIQVDSDSGRVLVRCRLVALSEKEGKVIPFDGSERVVRPPAPEESQPEPIVDTEDEPPADVLAGYDLVEPTEGSILMCGRIIHSVVEAMNSAHNETTLSWEQSRESVIAGIRRTLDNPGETPEQNHEAWMAYRASEGWVYGEQKDPVKKTHPCMVPYGALGPFQRSKDSVFHAVVRTMFGDGV